jgi:hypothetical protein
MSQYLDPKKRKKQHSDQIGNRGVGKGKSSAGKRTYSTPSYKGNGSDRISFGTQRKLVNAGDTPPPPPVPVPTVGFVHMKTATPDDDTEETDIVEQRTGTPKQVNASSAMKTKFKKGKYKNGGVIDSILKKYKKKK